MDPEDELPGGVGWKLHLAVPEKNQDLVEAGIQGMGITPDVETPAGEPSYKRGRASGQEGKDFTVYMGHKDDAQLVAGEIDTQMGHLLSSAEAVKTDTPMAGDVVGRFDAQEAVGGPQITVPSEMPGMEGTEGKYSKWGSGGVPYLAGDKRAQLAQGTDFDKAGAEERATAALTTEYGEAFTGSPPPQEASVGEPAGGGGGESVPSMDIASGDDGGGGGGGFDVRMIFDLVDEAVGEKAEELKNMAQIEAPFISGFLKESHVVERYAPASYAVVATAFYAENVHGGHKIKNKKGGASFGKTAGNPWMERAIRNLAE